MQPGIVERNRSVRRERCGAHALLVVERRASEQQPAELLAPDRQVELQRLGAGIRRPGSRDRRARMDHRAGRAGRLHGRLDDHPEELVDVVRRGERLAEARDRVAQPAALGLQLGDPRLELAGHLVERAAELGELVAAANVDAFAQSSARDALRRVREPAQCAHDRTTFDIRDEGDEREQDEQREQQAIARRRVRRVDARLRRQHREGRRREHAVPVQRDAARAVWRRGDDAPADDEGHRVPRREPGACVQSRGERPVERHGRDDRSDEPAHDEDLDPPASAERCESPDANGAVRGDHLDVRPPAQQRAQARDVAPLERDLERARPGERGGGGLGRAHAVVVRSEARVQPRLQPRVDALRLVLRLERAEPPHERAEREQRHQHEIGPEPEFEAAHGCPDHLLWRSRHLPQVPIPLSGEVFGKGGRKHERHRAGRRSTPPRRCGGGCRRLAAAGGRPGLDRSARRRRAAAGDDDRRGCSAARAVFSVSCSALSGDVYVASL